MIIPIKGNVLFVASIKSDVLSMCYFFVKTFVWKAGLLELMKVLIQ